MCARHHTTRIQAILPKIHICLAGLLRKEKSIVAFLHTFYREVTMENKSTIETYEDQKQKVSVFNLTSDLFAGKVFEDIGACQELYRILLRAVLSFQH